MLNLKFWLFLKCILDQSQSVDLEDIEKKIKKLEKEVKNVRIADQTLQYYFYLVSEKPNGTVDLDFLDQNQIIQRVNVNFKDKYGDTALHEVKFKTQNPKILFKQRNFFKKDL